MIDLRRLQVLRAVAHHGSVTAAAASLHLTPSAASQQIRHLARELQVALLEPAGRGVRLTGAARRLLGHADAIEERWQRAEADLADPSPTGELRICGLPTTISALLAPAVARLRERSPALVVRLREAEPPECFDLLFSGAADLVVTMATPGGPSAADTRFDLCPLLDDPYDLLTSPGHPLARRTGVALADLAAEPWIVGMPGTFYRDLVLALAAGAGFTPSVAHEVLEWTAVAALAGQGLGVSLVPRIVRLPDEPAVVRTELADAPARRLVTVVRRGNREAPAIAAALSALSAEIGEMGRDPGAERARRMSGDPFDGVGEQRRDADGERARVEQRGVR
ncbi:LysR family transcriptional regulator [Amycolatopsis sp. CA-230715]|uniref:LysR family transcriptional regulator n=1 Tax=Amycolatopsis sp. CA-230715 TaxID=2745196 RepID=UPI001C014C2C|nr:LysR family transcriptional regulator [Amycolatopsis sp. CA-230715]QWF81389.1 HTH-type transcriptional regulator GltC [Amycolatopsis sp. CA-230715]